jgi:hypothetical protein
VAGKRSGEWEDEGGGHCILRRMSSSHPRSACFSPLSMLSFVAWDTLDYVSRQATRISYDEESWADSTERDLAALSGYCLRRFSGHGQSFDGLHSSSGAVYTCECTDGFGRISFFVGLRHILSPSYPFS